MSVWRFSFLSRRSSTSFGSFPLLVVCNQQTNAFSFSFSSFPCEREILIRIIHRFRLKQVKAIHREVLNRQNNEWQKNEGEIKKDDLSLSLRELSVNLLVYKLFVSRMDQKQDDDKKCSFIHSYCVSVCLHKHACVTSLSWLGERKKHSIQRYSFPLISDGKETVDGKCLSKFRVTSLFLLLTNIFQWLPFCTFAFQCV